MHTPGPWRYQIWGGADFQQGAIEAVTGGLIVADIPKFERLLHGAENEANARLIAAAPELLAACLGIEIELSEWAGPEEPPTSDAARARNRTVRAYEAVRAAIAKAEGRG